MKPLLLMAGLAFASSVGVLVAADTVRAGLARVNITPDRPVNLAGYASRKELSRGIHDPLHARAIAFQQGQDRLVLVSTDNLGFYAGTCEATRTAILEECNLKPSELFLTAIHTHSAPTLALDESRAHANNVSYTRDLQRKLVDLTKTALAGLSPVELGAASGSSPVGVNRREPVRGEVGTTKIKLGRNPGGPCDPEVQILKVTAGQEKLCALLFAYATHSTSLGPRNLIISGDIHGLAEQFLERHWASEIVAPGFAGASGDIDPWYRVMPGFNTNNGWLPETVLMGTMLGEEVAHVSQSIRTSPVTGRIQSAFETLELTGKSAGTAKLNVTVAHVGNIAFVGLGGEIFSQIGKAIKTGSPFPQTFIFTHCNGTGGYLPTANSYAEGGYEVDNTAFAPDAADELVQKTVQMLKDLHASQHRSKGQ